MTDEIKRYLEKEDKTHWSSDNGNKYCRRSKIQQFSTLKKPTSLEKGQKSTLTLQRKNLKPCDGKRSKIKVPDKSPQLI